MRSGVALINPKGGVGKTSVALGLASAAWAANDQVLVVDLDPLGAATWSLGADPTRTNRSFADVLRSGRPGSLRDAIVASSWGETVDLVPASPRLAGHDGLDASAEELEVVAAALDGLDERYDAILIDCAPRLGQLAMWALAAADHALFVVEPSEFALRGIAPAAALVDALAVEGNPAVGVEGIVVNKLTTKSVENERRYAQIQEMGRPVPVWHPAVPERIVVPTAASERRPVHSYGSKVTDVTDAFDHLWLRTRRTVLRAGAANGGRPRALLEVEELEAAFAVEGERGAAFDQMA
jgi:cellulose biosynthesis protein BcsQ